MMHLTVPLEAPTATHAVEHHERELRPVGRRTPSGLYGVITPPLDLPSGIPLTVRVEYDPGYNTGELAVESAGVQLAHVAPLKMPLYLAVRLASDEVVCISVVK